MNIITEVQNVLKAATDAAGAVAGPGAAPAPSSPPDPGMFARPYLDAGHAAPSPQHQAPNTAPLPPAGRGILSPVELPAAPFVCGHDGPGMRATMAHQARAEASAGRPPVPRGSA